MVGVIKIGQITESFSNMTIQKMKAYYQSYLENEPPGAIFRARTSNGVITAYRSGKVLFQGEKVHLEVEKWAEQIKNRTENTNKSQLASIHSEFYPASTLFQSNHIGSDESGTGDYFGPITACAVYIKKEQIELLKEMGIQDSKSIDDKTIQLLAKGLVELNIPYSLMILHNEKYNHLQARGWSQGKMKTMIHHSVINSLLDKIGDAPYEGILIDQFCNPPIYVNHLKSEGKTLQNKAYFMTKAENYSIAVAAGSVIARASFLQEMDRLSNQIGFPLLKGASQKVDQLIAKIMKNAGRDVLKSVAKIHFKNTEKAEKYL